MNKCICWKENKLRKVNLQRDFGWDLGFSTMKPRKKGKLWKSCYGSSLVATVQL